MNINILFDLDTKCMIALVEANNKPKNVLIFL